MEAASIAFEPLGWKAVAFAEIDPFASAVLAHRFPDIPNYGDLTQHTDPTKWPISAGDVDLIIGGPPCQAFSVAGLRRGLADPRGSVTLSYLSLVDRLRPEWIVYENVPGLLSVDGGSTFGGFLHALGQLGYGWAYRILDAQHVGECRLHPHRRGWSAVPQRRRRVFVVARRGAGGWASSAEVLSLGEGLRRHLASGGKKRQGPAADAGAGVDASGLQRTVGTLCADTHPGAYSGQDAYTGRLIPQTMPEKNRFPAVMQPVCATGDHTHALTASSSKGATEDGTGRGSPIVIDRAAFNQGENAQYEPHIEQTDVMDTVVARGPHAVGVPFRKSKRAQSETDDESWVEGQQSNTLNNFDVGDTRTTHAVVEHMMPGSVAPTVTSGPPYSRTGNERVEAEALAVTYQPHIIQAIELRLRGQITEQTTCPTLLANTKSGDNDPLAVQAISFQPGNLCRQAGADPSTTSFPTLKCDAGDQALHVAHPCVPLDGMNLLSRLGECGETHSMQDFNPADPQFTLRRGGMQHGILTPMSVRRLTPNECLRLQGFPDNHTNIPWKGKPTAPDGPQYKCAGNSFAVPVVRWLGKRIADLMAKESQ